MGGMRFDNHQETGEITYGGFLIEAKSHLDVSTNQERGENLNAPSREGDCFLRHADRAVKISWNNHIYAEKLEVGL
jgi:hypothetical protein